MSFDPTSRIMLENGAPDNINRQLLAKIGDIESRAAKLRAEGRAPSAEMLDEISSLKASVDLARIETLAALDVDIAGLEATWTKARDKNPTGELAALQRARNEVDGLSDDEVRAIVLAYSSDDSPDLNMPTLNELRGRLRQLGEDGAAELSTLNDAVEKRRGDMPWLQSGEGRELADYRDLLSKLGPGEVLYRDPAGDAQFPVKLDDIIDYKGELDEVHTS